MNHLQFQATRWAAPDIGGDESRQHVFSIVESWRRNKLCFLHCLSCLLLDHFFFWGASARYSSCFSGVCRTSLVSRRVNDCLKNRCCNVNLKICQGAQSSQQTLGDISEESLVRGRDLAARDVK